MAAAYKQDYGKKGQIIVANLDEKNGEVDFKQLREVVDESVRSIEEEFLNEEAHEIPKSAVKSEESVDRTKNQDPEDPAAMPRFNPERDILLEDAKKIDKKAISPKRASNAMSVGRKLSPKRWSRPFHKSNCKAGRPPIFRKGSSV